MMWVRGIVVSGAILIFAALSGLKIHDSQALHLWGGNGEGIAVAPVVRGTIEDVVSAMGRLQPIRGVDVGTQISGQLKSVHVAVGNVVHAGQLVAEIDPSLYLSRVEASRISIAILKAQLADKLAQRKLAEIDFQRKSSLAHSHVVSQSDLDTEEAKLKSAIANVEANEADILRAEAMLRVDEFNLDHTHIFSPILGTVTSQSAFEGQTLTAIQDAPTIIGVADLSMMTVEAYVSEADVGKLNPGCKAYFRLLGKSERRWEGQLRQINPKPELVNNVVLYKALFDVMNEDGVLKMGMTAQVFFVIARADHVLTIPLSAIQEGAIAGGDAAANSVVVEVRRPDGTFGTRFVKIGLRDRVNVEVGSGLNEGDAVAIHDK